MLLLGESALKLPFTDVMGPLLVGLDGSPRATSVLEAAVDLARGTGRRLVLLRSFVVPPEMPPDVWKLDQASLLQSLREHAQAYLDNCARKAPKELVAETRVGIGVPWQAVCSAAKVMRADLIVIGSHGYGAIDHLLGTTAAKIVNHAECSVLVVRAAPKLTET